MAVTVAVDCASLSPNDQFEQIEVVDEDGCSGTAGR